jgi:hypothetical protein
VIEPWVPPLEVREAGGRCRLSLGAWAVGEGPTLQDAADDLIARLLTVAMCVRSSGVRVSSECPISDRRWLDFVWQVGEMAAAGEDVRELVFGTVPRT